MHRVIQLKTQNSKLKTRPKRRLRPADRALADALDQLKAGVPLNWTQLEDDPEIATLAALQSAAQEGRDQIEGYVPSDLRAELAERLGARLRAYRPEPAKAPPKPLAGFSEAVPVLTQAEEPDPVLTSSMFPWIAATAASGAVVMLVLYLVAGVVAALKPPDDFTWIDVQQEGRKSFRQLLPAGWSPTRCRDTETPGQRAFISVPDRYQLQLNVGYPVEFLPQALSVPTTYTLRLIDMSVSPCVNEVPDPTDPATSVKLTYSARRFLEGGYATLSPLVVFQAVRQPAEIDVTSGSWEEVRVGRAHGIYWRGGPYKDIEGTAWIGDLSVMLVESGDRVFTFIGQPEQGVTKEMLVAIVDQMEQARAPLLEGGGRQIPSFTWIELRQGGAVLSARRLSPDWRGPACSTPGPAGTRQGSTFQYLGSLAKARESVGYLIQSLPLTLTAPLTVTLPTWATPGPLTPPPLPGTPRVTHIGDVEVSGIATYTLNLADAAVRPCTGDQLQRADAGARVKLRYALSREVEPGIFPPGAVAPAVADVLVYEVRAQPITMDLANGSWKDVAIEGSSVSRGQGFAVETRGVYWQGGQYRDMEGLEWDIASVLAFERDDTVIVLVGNPSPTSSAGSVQKQGVDRNVLTALANHLRPSP
jgi:hypothetical protein